VRLGVRLVDQPVRIMVSGRMLGRGALAALGDELVVVVTETKALPEL
jgi:flagellar motor switch/type III secretory pathway protein FliN